MKNKILHALIKVALFIHNFTQAIFFSVVTTKLFIFLMNTNPNQKYT